MQVGGPGYQGGNGTGQGLGKGLGVQLANSQLITIDVIIGIGNICLLLILLFMYLRSYRDFKSKFTFGFGGICSFALVTEHTLYRIFTNISGL